MRNGNYELVKAPDGYPGKKYRGKYCYEHHLVWWQNTGELPDPGEVVHHKNENARDNRFENLEIKEWHKHSSDHSSQRGKLMLEMKCPVCGVIFVRAKRNTFLASSKKKASFCSRKCIGRVGMRPMQTEVLREFRDYNVV